MLSEPAALPALSPVDLPEEGWDGRLLTRLGIVVDTAMLQAMRLVVDAVLMPRPEELPEQRASAAPFLAGQLWDQPRRFFSFLDAPVAPTKVTSRYRRSIKGGVIIARKFATGYRPYRSVGRHQPPESPAADTALVEHWMHEPGQPRGTVLALHGFSMGRPMIDAFALFAADFFRSGLDVALLTLPYHGARTPAQARFSGERFAASHVGRLNEAVRQAVYEIHVVRGWLREQTGAAVGLLGLSLGGYLSALMAGLTSDLDFVIPMVPPVCMGDLASRFFSRSRHYRERPASAFSPEELRAAYRVHSPLTYPARVPTERLFIVAGRGDQIVPPEHPHALWRHWGEPQIYWFSGSHVAPFGRRRLVNALLQHLEQPACGLA